MKRVLALQNQFLSPPPTASPLRVLATTRCFSSSSSPSKLNNDGSHSDFQSKKKAPEQSDEVQEWIKEAVKTHPVLLFMKGTPEAPQCGFSGRVVSILKKEGAAFASADVIASPEVREGIKVFSKWPTIPQLYISGEFVGGADITQQLHESGELKEMLSKVKKQ